MNEGDEGIERKYIELKLLFVRGYVNLTCYVVALNLDLTITLNESKLVSNSHLCLFNYKFKSSTMKFQTHYLSI